SNSQGGGERTMGQAHRTFVGLDIGTTKICCIIADTNGNGSGELRVVGVGNAVSEGLRRGVVVDLEKTVASIARAVDEAERMAGAGTSAKNICRSIQRAGLKVNDLVLEPLASSHAVLGDDERDLGVVLLDMGGGTTDVAVFFEGSIRHTAIIPFGGANVTNDIAIGLRTPIDKAEQIKIQHGCSLAGLVSASENVTVSGVGGRADREISRHVLASM